MEDVAADGWREGTDLESLLLDQPQRVEFFQAVRLLELLHPERARIGDITGRREPLVRFRATPDPTFQASDVAGLTMAGAEDDDAEDPLPFLMTVAFLGLAGPNGPLPQPFADLLLQRAKRRDTGMAEFLDIFNHRLISLFYEVRKAIRPGFAPVAPEDSAYAAWVKALLGLATPGLADRMALRDRALLPFAGILAHGPRSVETLTRVARALFQTPVHVEQFVGRWHPLDPASHTHIGRGPATKAGGLGGLGVNNRLGMDAMLGTRAWIQDAKVEVRLGPLPADRFRAFLPDGEAFVRLAALVRYHLGPEVEADLRLEAAAPTVRPTVLSRRPKRGMRLGWTSWLTTRPARRADTQVVLRLPRETESWGWAPPRLQAPVADGLVTWATHDDPPPGSDPGPALRS